ncbi:MAG: AAA family ATPase [Acidobacteria bacterium]|nr:AAA family ATPase [Acidobacteriota bacterium]
MNPLREVRINRAAIQSPDEYPFHVPALRALEALEFTSPVTFLVGENGSGKSTFVEALAWASERVAAGSEAVDLDETLNHVRPLREIMRLIWGRRTGRGFFLRAEDFFGFVNRTKLELAELETEITRVRTEHADLPEVELSRRCAPYTKSIMELRARYGADPDARSHGEQFLNFFQQRLAPGGFYILDEPEAPLSPMRQLSLLAILGDAVREGRSQFVICTHSPILMAAPGAQILSFDSSPIAPIPYDETEHVSLTRDFLNRPEAFLRHLQ